MNHVSQMAKLYLDMLNKTTNEKARASTGDRVWCAVHTRYQHEMVVDTLLTQKGFETFLPTYKKIHRWKDRKKEISHALFPGYLFVANAHAERMRVVTTAGVCAVLSTAGVPAVIPDSEISNIRQALLDPFGVEPHPYLSSGDVVRIAAGPFEGLQGILVRKKGSTRLVVSVRLLGQAAAIEVDESLVRGLEPRNWSPISRVDSREVRSR